MTGCLADMEEKSLCFALCGVLMAKATKIVGST